MSPPPSGQCLETSSLSLEAPSPLMWMLGNPPETHRGGKHEGFAPLWACFCWDGDTHSSLADYSEL